jgi:purine-binding chemotaxis protein CheW
MGPLQLEVLIFALSGRHFGVPISAVQEVLRAVAITPLPRAPAIVEGVINLRGAIVPVLDVRARFALPRRALGVGDHFIVLAAARRVAVRVDRCVGIATTKLLRRDDVPDLPAGVSHVLGFGLIDEGALVIHDLGDFLTETEALALQALLAQSEPAVGAPA